MKNGDSAPVRPELQQRGERVGRLATMPDMMIRLVPLPMPRAVICSPIHIRNMVPPTSVMMQEKRKNQPGSITAGAEAAMHALEADGDAVGLEHGDQHGQIAGVLIELLAALLALLLQRLQRGDGGGHQLDDDAGADVGHDVQREDGHAPQRAAGEHVEHAEDAAAVLRQHLAHHRGVDAGDRDVGAEPVDDQRAEGEPDALLEFGRLGEDAEIEIGRKLFGSGGHGDVPYQSRVLLSARAELSASASAERALTIRNARQLIDGRPGHARRVYGSCAAGLVRRCGRSLSLGNRRGHRSARLLHRRLRRRRRAGHGDRDRPGDLAVAQQPHAVDLSPRASPAAISIASVIGWPASILPASIAASSAPRFTGA